MRKQGGKCEENEGSTDLSRGLDGHAADHLLVGVALARRLRAARRLAGARAVVHQAVLVGGAVDVTAAANEPLDAVIALEAAQRRLGEGGGQHEKQYGNRLCAAKHHPTSLAKLSWRPRPAAR